MSINSEDTLIENNTLLNNHNFGIGIYGNKNSISNNFISGSYTGIFIFNGTYNKVFYNTIESFRSFRIANDTSNTDGHNIIHNNNFTNGPWEIFRSNNNIFNLPLPIGGNYWSNFSEGCTNANGDSFCDSPYVFSGGQDNLPWIKKDGWLLSTNTPPTLSYSQDTGYIDDGINPDEGNQATSFTFKIVYTDADNDPPTDIRTVVFDPSPSEDPAIEVSSDVMVLDTFADVPLRDGNYANGEQYTIAKSFPAGIYRYQFQASDGKGIYPIFWGIAGGKEQRFEIIANQPPFASFTFEPQNQKAGEDVFFNASASYDPDGEIVLYGWDWDGDGIYDEYSGNPIITHNWLLNGTYLAGLIVIDDKNGIGITMGEVVIDRSAESIATANIWHALCVSSLADWLNLECSNSSQEIENIEKIDEWLRDFDGDVNREPDSDKKPFYWLKGTRCAGAESNPKQKACLISALNNKYAEGSGLTYKAHILSVITEQKMVEKAFITQTPDPYRLYMTLLLDWLPFTGVADIFYNNITSDGIRTFLIEGAPSLSFSAADIFTYGSSFLSLVTTAKKLDATFDKMNDRNYQNALGAYFLHRGRDPNLQSDKDAWEGFAKPPLTTQMSNEMLEETRIKFDEWWLKYFFGIQNKYGTPVFDARGLNNNFKQDLKNDVEALILFAVKNK